LADQEDAVRARAAQATTIVLFALVMGVFWGTWLSLSRTMDQLSAETFLAVGHEMIRNLGGPMAILLPLSLLSALVTLPADWRSIQSRWELWHTVRTFVSIAALVTATISAVVAARPNHPPSSQVVPPGGVVAGARSA
jgi:uncharacterized protein YneF (UPF0154 family)